MLTKKRRVKRHFQLLEVMVAAFIILICAVPALKIFTTIYVEQKEVVRENQRDHIARLIHANMIEQLYKRAIPLEEVLGEGEKPVADPQLQKLLNHWAYQGTYAFSDAKAYIKKGEEKASKYLVKLTITLNDASNRKKDKKSPTPTQTYDYTVYIDSGALDKEDKKQQPNNDDTNDEDQNLDEDKEGPSSSAKQEANQPKSTFPKPGAKLNSQPTGGGG